RIAVVEWKSRPRESGGGAFHQPAGGRRWAFPPYLFCCFTRTNGRLQLYPRGLLPYIPRSTGWRWEATQTRPFFMRIGSGGLRGGAGNDEDNALTPPGGCLRGGVGAF